MEDFSQQGSEHRVPTLDQLWTEIERLAKAQAYSIYDLELVSKGKRILKVFLQADQVDGKPDGVEDSKAESGVTLDGCAAVSRQISFMLEQYDLGEDYLLEVSSPGINRKLRRDQHFEKAVGERIKLLLHEPISIEGSKPIKTVLGELSSFEQGVVELAPIFKSSKNKGAKRNDSNLAPSAMIKIPMDQIKEAHVDFPFENF